MPKVRLCTGESRKPVSRGLGTRRTLPGRGRGATDGGAGCAAGAGSAGSLSPDGAVASSPVTIGAVDSPLIGPLRPLLQSLEHDPDPESRVSAKRVAVFRRDHALSKSTGALRLPQRLISREQFRENEMQDRCQQRSGLEPLPVKI